MKYRTYTEGRPVHAMYHYSTGRVTVFLVLVANQPRIRHFEFGDSIPYLDQRITTVTCTRPF